MADQFDTMMQPPVEELLDRCGSKFSLVTLAARRAREINSYYAGLGGSTGGVVPPQVTSSARKSLSMSFEEIFEDKIEGVGGATGRPLPERPAAAGADDEATDEAGEPADDQG